MIKEIIKKFFTKKYFVFNDIKLIVDKNIAEDFQSTFEELLCIAKILGYVVCVHKKQSYVRVSFYRGKQVYCHINISFYKNKVTYINVGAPQIHLAKLFSENKHQYSDFWFNKKHKKKEMVRMLKLAMEMILER